MITLEQLKDIKERTQALNRYLDIEGKKIQVEEEQLRTQAPGFWDDQKAAEAQMKKVKALQQWIEGYQEVATLAEEVQLSFDFFKDELVTEAEVEEAYANGKLDEAFGTGTAAVVSPMGLLDTGDVKMVINNNEIGPVAQKLYDTLTAIQWGKAEDKFGWTVKV